MTNDEWNSSNTTFEKLLEVAITLPDWERRCRLAAVAICQQNMEIYPEPECLDYLNMVVDFANGTGNIEEVKKVASRKPVMVHGGLFHCIRAKPKTAILETYNKYLQDARKFYNNKRSESELKRANCNVLRHIFGHISPDMMLPLGKCGRENELRQLVAACLETGYGWGPLSDFVEEFYGREDLATHLRSCETHPHGCYVLDILSA